MGLLVVLPNRLVVPVFVEVFPAPPNNGVGLFCVCCEALPNKLPVVFVFGCVLPNIEVLPLGLVVLAFAVFPKSSEVLGAVVVLVLAEEVPKIDDVPAGFVLLVLPKSKDPVGGWFVVLAPPKIPPEVPPPIFWFWLVLVDPNNPPPPVALLVFVFVFVFPNNDGCVGCACRGLGVGFAAPKIEFPGFQVVKNIWQRANSTYHCWCSTQKSTS